MPASRRDTMLNAKKHEEGKLNVELTASPQRMAFVRPLIWMLVVWSFAFMVIFTVLLKIDHVRKYLFRDVVLYQGEIYDNEIDLWRQLSTAQELSAGNLTELPLNFELLNKIDDYKPLVKRPKRCTPDNNIVFLKTHKTASSTVTNILNRYADLRELTVVLPAMGDVRFAWPRKFHWSSVDLLRLDGQPANILANHARYNRAQMNMIMEDNTKYISILRDPVTQFESSFYYFEFDRILKLKGVEKPIERFLEYPDQYLYNLTLRLGDLPDTLNLLQSGMFYDFGYDFMDLQEDSVIEKVLRKLEGEFDLVLIMEYFDESLVLLKKEMCWDNDDILYIKQNQRLKHGNLSEITRDRIRRWNRADVMLYQHFNRTFWKKINNYGPSFWTAVGEFRQVNHEFERICAPQQVTTKGHRINVDVNSFVMNPKVDRYNRYLCEKVLMTEVDYLAYFKKKFGSNSGYQSLLVAQGMKMPKREQTLSKKLKLSIQSGPRFFRLIKLPKSVNVLKANQRAGK